MEKITYDVIYYYYQYNSGLADNGYGTKLLRYNKLEDAQKMYQKINASISKREIEDLAYKTNDYSILENLPISEDDEYDLMCDLLPYSGYFIKVQLAKTKRERVLLNEDGKELKVNI